MPAIVEEKHSGAMKASVPAASVFVVAMWLFSLNLCAHGGGWGWGGVGVRGGRQGWESGAGGRGGRQGRAAISE